MSYKSKFLRLLKYIKNDNKLKKLLQKIYTQILLKL
jgi:hypothetical protein